MPDPVGLYRVTVRENAKVEGDPSGLDRMVIGRHLEDRIFLPFLDL
jgi:hypothetical protein